jgi:hypothetical protein
MVPHPLLQMYSYHELFTITLTDLQQLMLQHGLSLDCTKTRKYLVRRIMHSRNHIRFYIDAYNELLDWPYYQLLQFILHKNITPLSKNKKELIKLLLDNLPPPWYLPTSEQIHSESDSDYLSD